MKVPIIVLYSDTLESLSSSNLHDKNVSQENFGTEMLTKSAKSNIVERCVKEMGLIKL